MARTYEDWEKDAKQKGLYDTFSKRDITEIQKDTNYGDTLLNSKVAYGNATSDDERTAAKLAAETARNSKGYYGSTDGTEAYSLAGTQARTDADTTKGLSANTLNLIAQFSAKNGKKTSYTDTVDSMLLSMINGNKFSYDAKSDPRYKLAQEYAEQAMKNQMAESASLTGGYGNSYAANVGQSVYNDYMGNAAVDLEDRAYSRYNDEQNRRVQQLQYMMELDNRNYNREQEAKKWDYQAKRDDYTDALQRVVMTGVAGESDADLLGIPAGTLTAEEKSRLLSQYSTVAGLLGYTPEGSAAYLGTADGTPTLSAENANRSYALEVDKFAQTQNAEARENALNTVSVLAQAGMLDSIDDALLAEAGVTRDYAAGISKIYQKQSGVKQNSVKKDNDVQSKDYNAVLKNAVGYKTIEDAKTYLEHMVDLYQKSDGERGITPEEMERIMEQELPIAGFSTANADDSGLEAYFAEAKKHYRSADLYLHDHYKEMGYDSYKEVLNAYYEWLKEN